MRSLLTGELAQAQDWSSDYFVKLEVQNGSGTWIDVGAALGKGWIINLTISETIDTPIAQATFTLVQNVSTASMAPLMSASVLNVDDHGAYAPLLDIGRLFRASTATMAHGVTLDTAKYREAITGRIDEVSGADSQDALGPITLTCSDLGAWLMDLQIETDNATYGDAGGVPLETVLQQVLTNNVPATDPVVTIVKESSSSFAVTFAADGTAYRTGTVKVLEALTALVLDTTGEDLRYRYDASHVSQLTWFNPDRNRSSVDATFGQNGYLLNTLGLSIANVRNVVRMPYTDAMTGTAGEVIGENLGSIDKYRRRFNGLPGSNLLNSQAQAQTVVDAVASDLGDAPAQATALLPFFWPVQLCDRYTFTANNRQYDQDQTLGVVGYTHAIESGKGTTTLTLAGRIVGAYNAWLKKIAAGGIVAQSLSILRIDDTESADGTEHDFTLIVGSRVDSVAAYYRTVTIDETQDTHDFSSTAVLPVDPGSPLFLRPASDTRRVYGFPHIVTFSLPQPPRGYRLAARFVPYYGTVEGESVPVTVDAAPPAINAIIHATKAANLANLSIDIAFGASDGPVSVSVIETVLGVNTTLLTIRGMTDPSTIDWTTNPELADRPIPPDADSLSWSVTITDVSGQAWTFGPTVALPSVVNWHAVPSESGGVGTVTVTLTDSGHYLDTTHVDGSVTAAVSWHVTKLGVTTILPSTTVPGGGATSGVYTFVQTLDPLHPILIAGFVHYVDSTTEALGAWTFDSDKIADVVNATVATVGGIATVTVVWDTDALTGTNCGRYSLDGGSTWTSFNISAGYLSQFTVAQTTSKQTVIVEAKNAVDGGATYGHQSDGQARTVEISAQETGGAAANGTVAIDANGNWSFTTDGPTGAQSIRYGVNAGGSTTGYPADATVTASGSIVTGGGPTFSVNNGGTLSFGQTIWITVVFFSGTSASGSVLKIVHIRGSYQTFSATKTVNYSRTSWRDLGNIGYTTDADGNVINVALSTSVIRNNFGMTALVPIGCQLVSAAFDVVWNTATTAINSFTLGVNQGATNVNVGSPTYGGGFQNVVITLGSYTVSSTAISLVSHWGNVFGSGTADAGQAILADCYVTYTMPDPAKTI